MASSRVPSRDARRIEPEPGPLLDHAGVPRDAILHAGQSQFTDLDGVAALMG
ncbi:MAG: hypothetical protein ACK5U4_10290 [Rhodospirillales bacterium]